MNLQDKLNQLNKVQLFDFEAPEHFEYRTLADLAGQGKTEHQLKALFINTKSRFGDSPVAVTNESYVNLPNHLLDTVRNLMADDEIVYAINQGAIGFKIREYTSKQWGRNYTVEFIQINPLNV